jgi:hypothetical protein
LAGATHDTDAWPLPAVAATDVGGSGGPGAGVTEFEASEDELVPEPFVAVTVNV